MVPKYQNRLKKKEDSFEFLSRHDDFRHQHDCRRFVEAALNAPEKEAVVVSFYMDGMLNPLFKDLLTRSYSLDAGQSRHATSFQRIAVPLCVFLTLHEVRYSLLTTSVAGLYRAVLDTQNFPFIDNCSRNIKNLLENNSPPIVERNLRQDDTTEYQPKTLFDVVEPIARLLLAIISMDSTAVHENQPLKRLYLTLCRADAPLKSTQTSASLCKWSAVLQGLHPFFKPLKSSAVREIKQMEEADAMPHTREDPPGHLSKKGPRHDCDFELFTQIPVHLTSEEVLKDTPPYLPLLSEACSPWIEDPMIRHIDALYRLLRYDMNNMIVKAYRQFIERDQSVTANAFEIEGEHSAEGMCYVWEGVRVPCISTGSFEHAFRLKVPQIADGNFEERKEFWDENQGTKLLQGNSLAILIVPGSEDRKDETVLITKVVNEDRQSLSQHPWTCFVDVVPVNDSDVSRMIALIDGNASVHDNQNVQLTMLQVMGHFTLGNEIVMNVLKTSDLSSFRWGRSVCTPKYNSVEDASTPKNCSSLKECEACKVGAPEYLSEKTFYNLSFLSNTDEGKKALAWVNVYDTSRLLAIMRKNEKNISLDESQMEAFAFGITKEISLIQGPPGCGKTFIGVQIVKAILSNHHVARRNLKPDKTFSGPISQLLSDQPTSILCVCFTNHALDQFLGDLIQDKAVKLNDIVRIGKRTTSEILKEREIGTLHQASKSHYASKTEYPEIKLALQEEYRKKRAYETLLFEIGELVHALQGQVGGEAFGDWMEQFKPKVFSEIVQYFKDISSGNAAIDKMMFDDAIASWIHGTESPETEKRRNHIIENAKLDFIKEVRCRLRDRFADAKKALEELNMSRIYSKLHILKSARVVGCTTSGAAMNRKLLSRYGPRIIVGEEAAEASEGHLLATLAPTTQHLILIGDHEQLRPRVTEFELTVDSGKGYNLDTSLFERLEREKTVPIARLSVQRRMHPKIADLARISLYPFLKDSPVVKKYGMSPTGFVEPLFFWAHDHPESDSNKAVGRNRSYYNTYEVEQITNLAKYVLKQGFTHDKIAVLTPYIEQLKHIRERFAAEDVSVHVSGKNIEDIILANLSIDIQEPDDKDDSHDRDYSGFVHGNMANCVRLSTVDNFQGEEADIVLISAVRSNDEGNLGFMKSSNRANVMLTRARLGMYIIGNPDTFMNAPEDALLRKVMQHMMEDDLVDTTFLLRCAMHKHVVPVNAQKGFPEDGGCGLKCEGLLPCGHVCSRNCHPDDRKHESQKCQKPCGKTLKCGHLCLRVCSALCGGCVEPTTITLECGHTVTIPCKNLSKGRVKCPEITKARHLAPCGHFVSLQCWEGSQPKRPCEQPCGKAMRCGHTCHKECSGKSETTCSHDKLQNYRGPRIAKQAAVQCVEQCGRIQKCGHICTMRCHGMTPCNPCDEPCSYRCAHRVCKRTCSEGCQLCKNECGWECAPECPNNLKCTKTCAVPCTRLPCNEDCKKKLECGHACPGVCGEECSSRFCKECVMKELHDDEEKKPPVVHLKVAMTENVWKEEPLLHLSADCKILVLKECGHAFKMEDLDKYVQLYEWYEMTTPKKATPMWKFVRQGRFWLPETPDRCPVCGGSMSCVKRYGRLHKVQRLCREVGKWLSKVRIDITSIENRLQKVERELKASVHRYVESRRPIDKHERLKDLSHNEEHALGVCGRVAHISESVRYPWRTRSLQNCGAEEDDPDGEGWVRIIVDCAKTVEKEVIEQEVKSMFLRAILAVSVVAIKITQNDKSQDYDEAAEVGRMIGTVRVATQRAITICWSIPEEDSAENNSAGGKHTKTEKKEQWKLTDLQKSFSKECKSLNECLGSVRRHIRGEQLVEIVREIQQQLESTNKSTFAPKQE